VVASDKLFFWLFQGRSDRLQPLVAELIDSMEGYSFSAPAIKELEVRLDGLFLPPPEQLAEKPALILEAQMAAAPDFLLRLYSESALLLRHQHRQGQPLRHWRVVVICPSRDLAFGDPVPVREFLEERVLWIELAPERLPPEAPPLQRALGLLLLPEAQVSASAIRHPPVGSRHHPVRRNRHRDRRYPGRTLQRPFHPRTLRHGRHHPRRLHQQRHL
jgi:hypothetical protein